jgi:hypothetical protein
MPAPRERIVVFLVLRDYLSMSGSLRAVDNEHWEAVYLLNGELYQS